MKFDFTNLNIQAKTTEEMKAAEIFSLEIEKRTGKKPEMKDEKPVVVFSQCGKDRLPHKDCFQIELKDGELKIFAHTVRGLLFGMGKFLMKTVYENGKITLISDIAGKHIPEKRIRGHQNAYRKMPNTYDAWSPEQFRDHFINLMLFGTNTTELLPPEYPETKDSYNSLMKWDMKEHMERCSHYANELDMDVSLWYPNDELPEDESAELRRETLKDAERIDIIFPPGGDPGDYPADQFVSRCVKITKEVRKVKPDVQMWPSAQMPRGIPGWGDMFVEKINATEDGIITGVIQGPNRAMEVYELRRRIDSRFPLRFYPDITHNLRCEYSVQYPTEAWHYSLQAVNSRESVNPRPQEYKRIHSIKSPYTVGSVSYSEGVTDDVNKFVWGRLEWEKDQSVRAMLEDYARLFFPGADYVKCAQAISGLEYNWIGDPLDNPNIENTLSLFRNIVKENPELHDNWRFLMHLYRAEFDMLVKMRRRAETDAIDEARDYIFRNDIEKAEEILSIDFEEDYYALHKEIFEIGDKLFDLIGMQTSVERHDALNWERGAVLDLIDRPVTNRRWYLKKLAEAKKTENLADYMKKIMLRNMVEPDEMYFSFAEHGYAPLDCIQQHGEPYMNVISDRRENVDADIPMELLKCYDHYTLNANLGGFTGDCDYKLIVTYHAADKERKGIQTILANGKKIFEGNTYGGERDAEFDKMYLAPGYFSATYILPKDVFVNGCLELEIGETVDGVEIGEFRIVKVK